MWRFRKILWPSHNMQTLEISMKIGMLNFWDVINCLCNQRFVKLTLVLKNLQISLHILLLRVIFQFFHRQKERKIDFLYIKALHKIERNINFDFKGYFWGSKQFFIRVSCFGFHKKGCLSETPRLILLTCNRNTNTV